MEAAGAAKKRERAVQSEKPYKGIRIRKWGKWIAEIKEPNKRTRIWLASYSTPVVAAHAYDTTVYHLRGASARLNFPELLLEECCLADLSASAIRRKAIEVGARVDALEIALRGADARKGRAVGMSWFDEKPDLNKKPEPEDFEWED